MPDAPLLNWIDVEGILERLGFEQVFRAGAYAVFSNEEGQGRITLVVEEWDIPFDDLARDLSAFGISRVEVEAALESLYSDH